MKIGVDTNVLVRAIMDDDPRQAAIAREELRQSDLVTLATSALCELVWVLASGYKVPPARIAEALRRLLESDNVVADRGAVGAGLDVLESGGDFADGAIAHESRRLGATEFVSFDRKAVRLLKARNEAARLL